MDYLMDILDAFGVIDGIISMLGAMLWFVIIGFFVMWFVFWEFNGYMIMLSGRKAGLDTDWKAYVPVARELYQLQIVGKPWWYILLFKNGLVHAIIAGIIATITGLALGSQNMVIIVLMVLLMAAYFVAVLVFTYFYYREFYPLFGFHSNTALVEVIGPFTLVSPVFVVLCTALRAYIAFSNSVGYQADGSYGFSGGYSQGNVGMGGYQENGRTVALQQNVQGRGTRPAQITGVAGKYAGAAFDVSNGEEVVFGRSAAEANVVFDQFETDISRRHCTVRYDAMSDQFVVTDYSTNGTYTESGSMLPPKQPVSLERGTVIYLGKNKKNSFRLS